MSEEENRLEETEEKQEDSTLKGEVGDEIEVKPEDITPEDLASLTPEEQAEMEALLAEADPDEPEAKSVLDKLRSIIGRRRDADSKPAEESEAKPVAPDSDVEPDEPREDSTPSPASPESPSEPSGKTERVEECRRTLRLIEEYFPKLKPQVKAVRALISKEYAGSKPRCPSLSHIFNKLVGALGACKIWNAGLAVGLDRKIALNIIEGALTSIVGYEPPGPKPPSTFYLPQGHADKTDQYGRPIGLRKPAVAKARAKPYTKPMLHPVEEKRRRDRYWARHKERVQKERDKRASAERRAVKEQARLDAEAERGREK